MSYSFMRPNEIIIMERGANHVKFLFVKSGNLVLTNQRLIFSPYLSSKVVGIELAKITAARKSFKILYPSPCLLKVETTDGETFEFVVPKTKLWESNISNAILNAKGVETNG